MNLKKSLFNLGLGKTVDHKEQIIALKEILILLVILRIQITERKGNADT